MGGPGKGRAILRAGNLRASVVFETFGRLCPYRGRNEAFFAGSGRREHLLVEELQWQVYQVALKSI